MRKKSINHDTAALFGQRSHMPLGSLPPRDTLLIFTRYPRAGVTKTRLIPSLGPQGAALVQRWLTEAVIRQANLFSTQHTLTIEIWFTGGTPRQMRRWLGEGFLYRRQAHGDIGQRMKAALTDTFRRGTDRAVLVGSDIPGLTAKTFSAAFTALSKRDVVLGPTVDGGYCLIGMSAGAFQRASGELFSNIPWSTDRVISATVRTAKDHQLHAELLPKLVDIDRPQDLAAHPYSQTGTTGPPFKRVSIIIPTLNEAGNISATIKSIQPVGDTEVIVADGGSTDGTPDLAHQMGARIHRGSPPRSVQMNAGADMATGQVLLFLHADTCLPVGFDVYVRWTLARPRVVAGAFELGITGEGSGLRWIERVANWRSHTFQMPYGDQAIFLSRQRFHDLGGFKKLPIMEDYELIKRLSRRGYISTVPLPVLTSGRRWKNMGIVKTWLINQTMVAGYHLNVPPHLLLRWYRRERGIRGRGRAG